MIRLRMLCDMYKNVAVKLKSDDGGTYSWTISAIDVARLERCLACSIGSGWIPHGRDHTYITEHVRQAKNAKVNLPRTMQTTSRMEDGGNKEDVGR